MTTPLPIALISGFLGSGKTTLMRRLILDARKRGLKLAVIVNEFGAADVDSNILREADAELIAGISGGCACCSGQDDFHEALLEISARDVAERPDLVLVEASGLADPVLLLDVMTAAQLLPRLRTGSIVSVVDSARFLELAPRQKTPGLGPLLRRQTQLADLVVLNKVDLVDHARLKELEETVRELNPHGSIVRAEQCVFDLDSWWQRVTAREQPANALRTAEAASSEAAHAHYHTVVCPLPHPVERARLEAALQGLPPDVWRAKGFVRLRGEGGLYLVQYTGGAGKGRYNIAPFYLPFGAIEPTTELVFIGPALDRVQLLAAFLDSKLLSIL